MVDGSSSQVISNLFGWWLYDSPGYVHHSWLCPLPHLSHPVSYWVVLTLHVLSHICFFVSLYDFKGLLWWLSGKKSACQYSWCWLDTLIFLKTPWRRKWQSTPVFLPRKSHGEKPGGLWLTGSQELGTTEQPRQHTTLKPWVTKQLRGRLRISTVSHRGTSLKAVYAFNRREWGSGWAGGKTMDTNAASGSHHQQARCPFTILSLYNLVIIKKITKNRKQGQWQHF